MIKVKYCRVSMGLNHLPILKLPDKKQYSVLWKTGDSILSSQLLSAKRNLFALPAVNNCMPVIVFFARISFIYCIIKPVWSSLMCWIRDIYFNFILVIKLCLNISDICIQKYFSTSLKCRALNTLSTFEAGALDSFHFFLRFVSSRF